MVHGFRQNFVRQQSAILGRSRVAFSRRRIVVAPGVLTSGQVGLLSCNYPANNFNTSPVGGGKSVVINPSGSNQVLFSMSPNGTGGTALTQFGKAFVGNSSGTGAAYDTWVYLENSGIQVDGSSNLVYFAGNSPGELTPKMIRFTGFNGSGGPQQTDVVVNADGVETVVPDVYGIMNRAVLLNQATGLPVPADNDILLFQNEADPVYLGKIPQGCTCCNWDIQIGLGVTGLNDSVTISDASVPPAGVSFGMPTASGVTGFHIPLIPPGEGMAIWHKWVLPAMASGAKNFPIWIGIDSDDGS